MERAVICKCGRPRYTSENMARWHLEDNAFRKLGGDPQRFNPEWARAICWAMHDVACQMKPLEPSK